MVEIDLINNLKYRLIKKYKYLENQEKVSDLINLLVDLEKKINLMMERE